MRKLKKLFKNFIQKFPIALTKTEAMERNLVKLIPQLCIPSAAGVDVGSNSGRLLQLMIQAQPNIMHYAFEPLPKMFNLLVRKYGSAAHISKLAISDEEAVSPFYHTQEETKYSGIRKMNYPRKFHLEKLEVNTNKLDNVIPETQAISMIAIDVQGAEYKVLKGAKETVDRCKPAIVLRYGVTASEKYDIPPEMLFDFFSKTYNYQLFELHRFLQKRKSLSRIKFSKLFDNRDWHYLVAIPQIEKKKRRSSEN